ncbi:nucleotide exchange factor GrpE [Adlercreutzia sp. ZJ154]|uniref:nucleotide exchange factor GrpE n=1 Tax=Adlercreutzia sp. ZJ154 TaxID=2709790 RepID=UPI001F15164F|nr:nucleotide exchange factor GrpE [Adlercreutzia sp. ZJ154]
MTDSTKDQAAKAAEDMQEGAPTGAPDAVKPNEADAADNGADANSSAKTDTNAENATSSEQSEATSLEDEAEALVADAAKRFQDEGEKVAETETEDNAAAAAAAEIAEWKDKYVRLHAEWDTYRRRTKEQREEEKVRAAEKLVVSLLPVLDDLERTINYAEKNTSTDVTDGLLDGVKAVLAKFVDTLQKDGVVVLNPVGEAFDALEAQAVGTVEDTSQPDETVNEVYQKGYKMGSKVLRPAMVTVTTGGPKREKPAEKE